MKPAPQGQGVCLTVDRSAPNLSSHLCFVAASVRSIPKPKDWVVADASDQSHDLREISGLEGYGVRLVLGGSAPLSLLAAADANEEKRRLGLTMCAPCALPSSDG